MVLLNITALGANVRGVSLKENLNQVTGFQVDQKMPTLLNRTTATCCLSTKKPKLSEKENSRTNSHLIFRTQPLVMLAELHDM